MASSRLPKIKDFDDISHKEQIERYLRCISVLKKLPKHAREKHWDMSVWGRQTGCGTVTCAAGTCGLDPWFIKRGLKLEFPKISLKEIKKREAAARQEAINDGHTNEADIIEYVNNSFDSDSFFKGYAEPVAAVRAFFGYDGTDKIFTNGENRSVNDVIEELETYVKLLKLYQEQEEIQVKIDEFQSKAEDLESRRDELDDKASDLLERF